MLNVVDTEPDLRSLFSCRERFARAVGWVLLTLVVLCTVAGTILVTVKDWNSLQGPPGAWVALGVGTALAILQLLSGGDTDARMRQLLAFAQESQSVAAGLESLHGDVSDEQPSHGQAGGYEDKNPEGPAHGHPPRRGEEERSGHSEERNRGVFHGAVYARHGRIELLLVALTSAAGALVGAVLAAGIGRRSSGVGAHGCDGPARR